jgi:hypothetical protein
METQNEKRLTQRIRFCIWIMIAGLAISGITAFPLETELQMLVNHSAGYSIEVRNWLNTVYTAIKETNQTYPFLSYGTDWLAFAHVMLAIVFVGPLRNPVKNIWVIEFGMIACVLIIPLAFIAGEIRGIPFFWRLVDCSFGVIGIIPLMVCHRAAKRLQAYYSQTIIAQYV